MKKFVPIALAACLLVACAPDPEAVAERNKRRAEIELRDAVEFDGSYWRDKFGNCFRNGYKKLAAVPCERSPFKDQ